jgi:hypothetical protein
MFVPNMQNVKKRALGKSKRYHLTAISVNEPEFVVLTSVDAGSPKGSRIRVG